MQKGIEPPILSQPSIDALIKLARTLNVATDELLFDEQERGPSDDLRLHFEAIARMSDDERRIVKALLEGMILKHEARRWEKVS